VSSTTRSQGDLEIFVSGRGLSRINHYDQRNSVELLLTVPQFVFSERRGGVLNLARDSRGDLKFDRSSVLNREL
jgi:hypothetical protein